MRLPLADLRRAVAELACLRGRFVDNVYQCGPKTFLLKLKPDTVFVVVDVAPQTARVLATDAPPPIPDRPPTFGAILRRALRGARFLGAVLPGEDRVVFLDFDAGAPRRLVAEAFARFGNLLLLDERGVVERVVDGDAARHRGNPVGAAYTLPEAPRIPAEESLLPGALPDAPLAANFALDRLFREQDEEAEAGRETRDRERILARLRKTKQAVEKDLAALDDPARLRRQGETLLAHFADLARGMKSFSGVPLDPKLNPQENVERVFERARKAERAEPILRERLADVEDLIARVEAGEDVPERRLPPVRRKGEPQPPRKPYRVFRSADGHRILVGKGGRDNDETTLKVAGPNDLFLHVRGTPGSHVIVPLDRGRAVTEQTLLDAATLAVHYSKMRAAAAADVTYTERKNVTKPRGAKPGLVRVSREKVLRLRREPDRLARLLMSGEA